MVERYDAWLVLSTFKRGYILDNRERAFPFPPFHDYKKHIPVKCTPRLSSLVPIRGQVRSGWGWGDWFGSDPFSKRVLYSGPDPLSISICFPDPLPDFRLTAGGWGHSPHTPPAQVCSNPRTLNLTPYVDTVRGSEGGICLDKAKGLSGIAAWGVPGLSPRTPEKFSKIFIKNQWKITILGQFFKILRKIL